MNQIAWNIAVNTINDYLHPSVRPGRPRVFTSQELLTLFVHMCKTNQPWNTLHTKYKTLHRNFRQLTRDGVFDIIQQRIRRVYTSQRTSKHHITDTSYIKNILGRDVVGKNHTDRGRLASKLSTVTDDIGVVLLFHLFPVNKSDTFNLTLHWVTLNCLQTRDMTVKKTDGIFDNWVIEIGYPDADNDECRTEIENGFV